MASVETLAHQAGSTIEIASDSSQTDHTGCSQTSYDSASHRATGTSSPNPGISSSRVCVVCGSDLSGRRTDALVCGPACRVERSRLLAILRGSSNGPYRSVVGRLQGNPKRTNWRTNWLCRPQISIVRRIQSADSHNPLENASDQAHAHVPQCVALDNSQFGGTD